MEKEKKKYSALRVLLISQDKIASDHMERILGRLGIHCTVMTEESKIMENLQKVCADGSSYDICFVNWQVPDGFGRRMTEVIRQKFERDVLKIVAFSYNTADQEYGMLEAGADYVLKKPVLQAQVYEVVSDICSHAKTNA